MTKYKDTLGMENINFSIVENCSKYYKSKYKKQRLERGFDDSETWNLDSSILHFILPRLKRFKEVTNSFPANMNSFEEWEKILNKAISDIELIYDNAETENMSSIEYKEHVNKQNQAKNDISEFLGKYLFELWW